MGKIAGTFLCVSVVPMSVGAPRTSAAQSPVFQVAQGDIRVTVPLRPGGAFEARTTSLSGMLTLGGAKPETLSQAAEIAESQAPGRAVGAELGQSGNHVFYDVEIIDTRNQSRHLRVDAETGKIVKGL